MTINELEMAVQSGLEALRVATINPEVEPAKELFVPDGLSPVVQLVHGDDLRKKRSNAAAWNWNPLLDKVIISFRPSGSTPDLPSGPKPSGQTSPGEIPSNESAAMSAPDATGHLHVLAPSRPTQREQQIVNPVLGEHLSEKGDLITVTAQEIIECCQALAQAEKSNRPFIAIKWFRDELLPTVDYAWAQSSQHRQQVLSQAIAMGRIDLKKLPNPKLPDYPTTAISLNRSVPIPGVTSRFNPVPIRGEAGSTTLLADRGTV
jgi:hypothetical protein